MQGVIGAFAELDSTVHAIEDLRKQNFSDITAYTQRIDSLQGDITRLQARQTFQHVLQVIHAGGRRQYQRRLGIGQ